MKVRSPFFAACCFAATGLSLLVAACSSPESRARESFAEYQTAAASGDMIAARTALLATVAAQDDNPLYWEELAKVQVQLGSFTDAYYAFTRAYELDRTNPEILGNLTQLALLSGEIDIAEDYAKKLELVSPNDPVIKLAYGYSALKRQSFDEADKQSDALLQMLPYESGAKLLKARILVARGKVDDATRLLEGQVRARPDDVGSLKALMALYERREYWRGVAVTAARIAALKPAEKDARFTAIDAALRSGDDEAAMRVARPLLQPDAPGDQVEAVLRSWSQHWKGPQAVQTARELSRSSGPQQRLAYATYFNENGHPEYAAELVGTQPILPITIGNSSTNAIIADAMAQNGQTAEAKRILDEILLREPDHVYALRARINLEIRSNQALAAVTDAQRLVVVLPKSARDRLLLARAYAAAGNARQVDRTLWDAFHEIPANRELYEALRAYVSKSGNRDAVQNVDSEYRQKQDTELVREFI